MTNNPPDAIVVQLGDFTVWVDLHTVTMVLFIIGMLVGSACVLLGILAAGRWRR